jgi:hypothetical protein
MYGEAQHLPNPRALLAPLDIGNPRLRDAKGAGELALRETAAATGGSDELAKVPAAADLLGGNHIHDIRSKIAGFYSRSNIISEYIRSDIMYPPI